MPFCRCSRIRLDVGGVRPHPPSDDGGYSSKSSLDGFVAVHMLLLPMKLYFPVSPFLTFIATLAVSISAATSGETSSEADTAKIHEAALTLDSHLDTPLVMKRPFFDFAKRHDPWKDVSQVDLPRMIEGGLDGGFFVVYLAQGPRTQEGRGEAKEQAREIFDLIHSMIDENPDRMELALTADDADRIRGAGKRVIYIGIENGYALGRDLDLLAEFYDLGGRYLGLAHTRNNAISDSSTDPDGPEHGGLSDFGRAVIREMNRLGMMVDISHISDDAAIQAIEMSEAPVIASHSSAHALYEHPRNLNDEILRAIARTGGVVQMNMFSGYLKETVTSQERKKALGQWREEYGSRLSAVPAERLKEAVAARGTIDTEFPPDLATLDTVMDNIDHVVKVAGIDHVGLGADFDGGGGVEEYYDVSTADNVTRALTERGYTEEEIFKIWSGNLLRVMRANEEVARRFQEENPASANDE